jgi:hypothetical protein
MEKNVPFVNEKKELSRYYQKVIIRVTYSYTTRKACILVNFTLLGLETKTGLVNFNFFSLSSRIIYVRVIRNYDIMLICLGMERGKELAAAQLIFIPISELHWLSLLLVLLAPKLLKG